ncbi:hypothetical protein ACL02U_31570 [Streptomyces sp. MS06]|uniref:hypothetical protein n=1 Tax=Streptomyces sp. MS06 TaxID=3385974 RepID=UPI00399EE993
MPFRSPPLAPSGPRRRSLLASTAGVALLAGCSASGREDGDGGSGGSPSLAERARARAVRDSRTLAERYDAVLAAHPALAKRLGPLRAEVARHAEAFGGWLAPAPSVSATPADSTPSGSPPPGSVPASPAASGGSAAPPAVSGRAGDPLAVPADPRSALAALASAEKELAERRTATLVDLPGEQARLLASVAAAGAAHAYLLAEGAK